MPFTVTMPKLSPTMEEGTIVKWHKKEGDFVEANSVLFEVATDKATVEYQALDEGYLRKVLVAAGKDAIVNQPVAIFTVKKEESIEGYTPQGVPTEKEEDKTEVKEEKEAVKESAGSAKANKTSFSQPVFKPEPPLEGFDNHSLSSNPQAYVPASPLAKKLAKEKGLDISTVKGSGPDHRVMSRDLDLAQPDQLVTFGSTKTPDEKPGSYEEEPLSPMRKVIAHRLQESKTFIPHFYVTQEIRADALMDLRAQLKSFSLNVSVNDLIVKACALALRKHPKVNSGFNTETNSIVRFKTVDIAVAVSIPDGLVTPIIRHADFKNVGHISKEVKLLAQKAKEGKLQRHEYFGGSFTISNLGMYGVSEFIGVINPPQAALLAVGGVDEKPVVENGSIVIGKVMKVTLSSDHRVIDGADAADFLRSLKGILENPAILLV